MDDVRRATSKPIIVIHTPSDDLECCKELIEAFKCLKLWYKFKELVPPTAPEDLINAQLHCEANIRRELERIVSEEQDKREQEKFHGDN